MKWFSFEGIAKEARRIKWPTGKELLEKSGKVLVFICLFALFFVLTELAISGLMNLVGITG